MGSSGLLSGGHYLLSHIDSPHKNSREYIFLWISQVICLVVLVACMGFSFIMYRHMMIGRQDWISAASLSSLWFNKISWLACGNILIVTTLIIFIFDMLYFQSIKMSIKHILEVSKAISYSYILPCDFCFLASTG